MGILTGNPTKQALHYGEVYSLWSFSFITNAAISQLQTLKNHTGDTELIKLISDCLDDAHKEKEAVEEILKANGIGLPPAPAEKPKANLEEIPVGARFDDREISGAASAMLSEGLIACSTVIGQSIREDIGMLFGTYHMNKAQLGAKALKLNKEKGWLIAPPLHTQIPNNES
ncbi:DUF3231 family protein [Halalkalibacillus halophilus]|uniref:DUF3231 family protein n=1 Tax=Halalkalibacillus halophilus TaxID=392827 RepID=UPI0003F6F350|nr:DUF3231 family protein [Halalkalibacillus halophilus]